MRKIILLLGFISLYWFAAAQQTSIKLNSDKTTFNVRHSDNNSVLFNSSIRELQLSTIKVRGTQYTNIVIDGFTKHFINGSPDVPVLNKLIELPSDSRYEVKIISYSEDILDLNNQGFYNKIIPAQPSLFKNEDPEKVKFWYNEQIYQANEFTKAPVIEIEEMGIMRGVKIGKLKVNHVKYNPVTNQLKIINNLVAEIVFKSSIISSKSINLHRGYESCFKSLINFERSNPKSVISSTPIKYVIVSNPMFSQTLQPFITWKRQKGFNVIEAYTDNPQVGNTSTSIKNYLGGLYNNSDETNPPPLFILFVGDIAQLPNFNGSAGTHVTDLYYCTYDGPNDFFPDVFYGRFSATTTEQLEAIVTKTINYEKLQMPDINYLNDVLMIAGVDGNYAQVWGNGQVNYASDEYFNSSNGFTSHNYFYPASGNAGTNLSIINDINKGVCFANYTAHGSETSWVNPLFNNTHADSLKNFGKYAFFIGNCCLTNKFDVAECLGEKLLRLPGKGAIGYIGGSNNTTWNEDYWWAVGAKTVVQFPVYDSLKIGAIDGFMHTHNESPQDWNITNGQILQAGNMAVVQAGGTVKYYWEIYHLMGDPSVMTYFGAPADLFVNYNNTMPVGLSTLEVYTEPWAQVAISYNGTLLDSKFADSTGIVQLTFPAFNLPSVADIVVTKQNRKPFVGTLNVIQSSEPFVAFFNGYINDSLYNNNQQCDYAETIKYGITFKNVGLQTASGVNAILQSIDSSVVISDSIASIGTILAGDTILLQNEFIFSVRNNVEDGHNVMFKLLISDSVGNSWTSSIFIELLAPKVNIISYRVNDVNANNNGRLDPGEVSEIEIIIKNNGHSPTIVSTSYLYTQNTYISLANGPLESSVLQPGSFDTLKFEANVSSLCPFGSFADFDFNCISGSYNFSQLFNLPVGLLVEDWESAGFNQFNWNNQNSNHWVIINSGAYEGTYALKSGLTGNNDTSEISISVSVAIADTISFYRKVSSEQNYDFLKFYIDNVEIEKWSGILPWEKVKFYVPQGEHTFTWHYIKDQSVVNGSDCAFIDFIVFPPLELEPNSMSTMHKNNHLIIYPTILNKGSDLYISGDYEQVNQVEIVNILGEKVFSNSVNANNKDTNLRIISSTNLSNGHYTVILRTNSETICKKIIIQK